MRLQARGGFTAIELMISASITAVATLWISGFITKPGIVARQMLAADTAVSIQSAMSTIVNDLQEASPASILWDSLPPAAPTAIADFSFTKTSYDLSNPTSVASISCQYYFVTIGNTTALYRSINGVASIVLNNIVAPTADVPFVQVDQNAPHILIISLAYTGANSQQMVIVRRVAIMG